MNKSRVLMAPAALMMAGMLLFSGCGKTAPAEQAEPSAEAPAQVVRTIGEASDTAFSVNLTNGTAKNIVSLSVLSDADSAEAAEAPVNLLENDEPITVGEQINLLYTPPVNDAETQAAEAVEETSDEGQPEEKELGAEYTVRFVTEDGTEYNLHAFPFEDLQDGLILLSAGDVAYMEYSSKESGEWVNTLEAEIATAERLAEEEKAAAEEAAKKAAEEKAAAEEAAKKAEEEKAAQEKAANNNSSNNTKKKRSSSSNNNSSNNNSSGSTDAGNTDNSGGDGGGDSGGNSGGGDSGGGDGGGDDSCLEDGLTW